MNNAERQDQIVREAVYPVSQDHLWAVLTEPQHLNGWFADKGTDIDLRIGGQIEFRFSYETCRAIVVGLDPITYFAWRWRPGSGEDPARPLEDQGPLTLVEFTLTTVPEGTHLRVVESGFAALTAERFAIAFGENSEGWEDCLRSIGEWLQAGGADA